LTSEQDRILAFYLIDFFLPVLIWQRENALILFPCNDVFYFYFVGIILCTDLAVYFSDTGPKEFAALWSCLGQWRVSSLFLFLLKHISFLYIAFENARHFETFHALHSL